MSGLIIRPAYSKWPEYNRRLREVVAAMTDEQLARPIRDSREVANGASPAWVRRV